MNWHLPISQALSSDQRRDGAATEYNETLLRQQTRKPSMGKINAILLDKPQSQPMFAA
jgi:hypothetical protein